MLVILGLRTGGRVNAPFKGFGVDPGNGVGYDLHIKGNDHHANFFGLLVMATLLRIFGCRPKNSWAISFLCT
jgi:hypothetical protein